ncbi:hypothetical protein FACS1894110_26260 [Spirochaetia bacterium]|nr:hypothetical protein FACS1894110_26260 [Spirochaetia bacterium]
MINLRLSGITGGTGFILSFLVGVLSGGGVPISLLRALLWGIVFFGLSWGIWALIKRFLPELLLNGSAESSGADNPVTGEEGTHVDISVDDGEAAIEEDSAGNDLGNGNTPSARPAVPAINQNSPWEPAALEDPAAGSPPADIGMDQNNKESYTKREGDSLLENGVSSDFVPAPLPMSLGTGIGNGEEFESLPDLDAMAGVFMPSEDMEEEDTVSAVYPSEKKPSDTKGQSMGGNLNSRELASAIQNILKKD